MKKTFTQLERRPRHRCCADAAAGNSEDTYTILVSYPRNVDIFQSYNKFIVIWTAITA